MSPKLYYVDYSQPVRAVLMLIEALNIDVELINISLLNKEQLKPEYLRINPQHSVPTLVDDDGFIIWDSHAIMPYLISKYGKGDQFYPKDYKKRAIIDQRLHFDSGVLFPATMAVMKPIIYLGSTTITESARTAVHDAYSLLETFLDGNEWVAGDSPTIADFSALGAITSLDILIPVEETKYPKIYAWLRRSEKLPYYGPNRVGRDKMQTLVRENLAKL